MNPLVAIYNEIEELEHIGHTVVKPYLMSQLMSYGLKIIKNTNDFETGILTWTMRPINEHTWPYLKNFFEEEYCVVVHGTMIQSAVYHHTNSLATQVSS